MQHLPVLDPRPLVDRQERNRVLRDQPSAHGEFEDPIERFQVIQDRRWRSPSFLQSHDQLRHPIHVDVGELEIAEAGKEPEVERASVTLSRRTADLPFRLQPLSARLWDPGRRLTASVTALETAIGVIAEDVRFVCAVHMVSIHRQVRLAGGANAVRQRFNSSGSARRNHNAPVHR